WHVFAADQTGIVFSDATGVVGDKRIRIDLGALHIIGDGLAWARQRWQMPATRSRFAAGAAALWWGVVTSTRQLPSYRCLIGRGRFLDGSPCAREREARAGRRPPA
ncbi:hypothetical protein, partial [Mycobacterium sp. NAZ190054]|uniref:hypothetical protein n=1 Tax=Mycobacterium sp. NAZ190054 TaxID=1747766 RepID=UPI000AB8B200